jgi:hypothetical protein
MGDKIPQKTKDGEARSTLKTRGQRMYFGRVNISCSASDTRRATVKRHK